MKPRSPASFSVSRVLRQAGDADRRMRRLQRLDVRLEEIEHRVGLGHRPELALVGPGRVIGPHLQDDLQRLAGHVAVLPAHAVDVEHRPVARQARCGDAEIQPAVGEMVEHRDAVGEFGRVMIGQQEAAGAEADILGLQKRLRQQQVGRRMRLPGRGVMLADPGFLIAELVEPAQDLQVPVVSLLQAALRRMRGHREISDFHGVSSRCSVCFSNASVARKRKHSTPGVWPRYDKTTRLMRARHGSTPHPCSPCAETVKKASLPCPIAPRTWSRRTAPSASRAASASIAAALRPGRRVRPRRASPSAGRRACRARARPCRPCPRRRSPRPASPR